MKQKQLANERRAAKPLADELARTKKIWERLRRKSHVPKEERHALVEELFQIITGRVKDFVLKHDSVRAVQTALKYASMEQRKQITKELQGTYAQLAESRYAKFLIGKMLVQNNAEVRDMIIPEFYGKVKKLINHPEASWILDDIYRSIASKEQKATLLREWYGAEYVLFKAEGDDKENADLCQIFEKNPEKRGPTMKHCMGMINQLVQKKMTGFTMLHDAMLQYFLAAKPGSQEHTDFLELVKDDEAGDLFKNMAFTKSGARLSCLLLAYGNAKDRKQYLRVFKDTFQLMSGDQYGHMIILTAYDVIDDTVLCSKTIFPEILGKSQEKEKGNVIFCANDIYARTTIRYLFEGTSKVLFFPGSLASDLALLEEVHEIRKTTSKKDPEIRRKELITYLSPPLLAAIAACPNELVSSSFGCQLVADVLLGAAGDKTAALQAIAETAAGEPAVADEKTYPPPRPHVSHTSHGSKLFKTLIQGGRFDKATNQIKPADPPLEFGSVLYPIIEDHILEWATGTSSFVVVALLESETFQDKDAIKKTLKKQKAKLEKAAKEETPEQKAKREAAQENGAKKTEKTGGKRKKAAPKQERTVGNAGSRLLLEKL